MDNKQIINSYFNYKKMLIILENYGIKNIKKSGNYFMCSCPWHKDDKPSFSISFLNGSYRCFSCGDSGDFFKFKSKIEGITYDEAKKNILNNFKHIYYQNVIMTSLNKLKYEDKPKQNITEILNVKKLNKFNNYEVILKYINISKEVANKFNLGLCLEKRYLGRLAIPLYNDKQTFWELRDLTKTSDKKVLYTKGTHVGDILYYNKVDENNDSVFLCEGTKDVLTMNSYGFNAMCCFGINISMKQIELMLNKGIKFVYLLYDNDTVGQDATKRNYPILKKYIDCQKIIWNNTFPKDPNECSKQQILQLLKNNLN